MYQYGKDVTGKNNNGKTIKLYNGNIISSFIRLRIPAKIMAKTLFSRLKKQNYKESKIELLGILIEDNSVMAYIRFDRINNSDEIQQELRAEEDCMMQGIAKGLSDEEKIIVLNDY